MTASLVRAAIYLRISIDREMDGLAIDRQFEDCTRIVAERGWTVVGTYVDQSRSATDKSKRRPEYDRMVRDYLEGSFDAIVCWDLDRLTRQPRQLEEWIDAAEVRGLVIVTANGEADLTSDDGRMYARVKAAVARAEVDRYAARRSAAERQRARRSQPAQGARLFGYDKCGEVIEVEAAVVRELFRLRALQDGPSIASMAAALSGESGEGLPTSLPHLPKRSHALAVERNQVRRATGFGPTEVPDDGPWPMSTVLGVLRNPRYAGYSVHPGSDPRVGTRRGSPDRIVRDQDGNPVRGPWDPIVDEATWSAVQDRLDLQAEAAGREPGAAHRYLGSGIYLCGYCSEPVKARSGRYQCSGPSGRGAGHFTRSSRLVDAFVLRAVHELLEQPHLQERLLSPQAPRLETIRAQIAEHRASIERVERDEGSGNADAADVARIRRREEPAIAELQRERGCLLQVIGLGALTTARDPGSFFDSSDLKFQRLVIDSLVDVRIIGQTRGRRGFDKSTVQVSPRASDR